MENNLLKEIQDDLKTMDESRMKKARLKTIVIFIGYLAGGLIMGFLAR